MGDKEPTRFHYDTYPTLASNQTTTAGIVTSSVIINNTNNGTNSLKRGVSGVIGIPDTMTQVGNVGVVGGQTVKLQQTSGKHKTNNITTSSSCNTRRACCSCMGSKSASFWAGLLTNLGICTLLFAYTLLGSFIFLAIEGGASTMQQRTLASTNRHHHNQLVKPIMRLDNVTFSPAALQDALEARQRIVENIWDITVSLNILYRENWTRLAALEIARFQDQLIKRLTDDMSMQLEIANNQNQQPSMGAVMIPQISNNPIDYDWTFARAFLYSLTVLTTIGYGSIAPKTTLGRVVTLAYALLGIPLTLVYLSSTGGVLARVARGVFSRALCCCLCSNCGYCCYDEKRMAEKERRMKRKRQQEEFRAQQLALQEPYYVRSGSLHNNLHSPEKQIQIPEIDSLSASESRTSMHGLSLLAPILLCLCMMIIYIVAGAIALYRLEGWPLLDGIYFCFMSLSTIGFGDLVPGLKKESTTTIWFCSIYIMSGMALTAMCFNVLHEEILHRLKHVSSNLNDKNNLSLVIDKNNASSTTISSHQMKSKNFNDSSDSEYLGS